MSKMMKLLLLATGVLLVTAAPVWAADAGADLQNVGMFSKYFGVGLTVVGAAYGIARLAASAYDGMSRSPEVASNIQTAMIIAAALIEGFTFFALLICMLY